MDCHRRGDRGGAAFSFSLRSESMKIVWDAGHGGFGVTAGKRVPDGSMYEWDFNNAVVQYAMKELTNYEDVTQLRVDDPTGKTDIPLRTRTTQANAFKSDVYVSVHANAFGSGGFNDVSGIETFVHLKTPQKTVEIATTLHNHLIQATGRKNRGVKKADFHVLRETNMSAILVECEFMTHKEASTLLKAESYRQTCASALVDGLVEYYNLQRKPEPAITQNDVMYRVVTGSFADKRNAIDRVEALEKAGFASFITIIRG